MYSLGLPRGACFGLPLLLSFLFTAVLGASASAQVYSSSAFGVSAKFVPPPVSFGPSPQASGYTGVLLSDIYGDNDSSSSLNVLIPSSGSNQGSILNLSTGTLRVDATGGSSVDPIAPNTSAGAFGIAVILNEQNVVQDGDSLSIEVNALRVVDDNFLLRRLGIIDG